MSNQAQSRGGSVTAAESPAKARALRALHARRRGLRTNSPGLTEHALRGLLSDVMTSIRPARPGQSIRALAGHCHVSDRTVRRWLDGTDWPDALGVRRMQSWLREN